MAINFREQSSGQAQVTQEDMAGKLAPIFYRMCDSYFKYADKINIFFQPDHFWLGLAEMESLAWIGRYSKDTGVVELFQNNEKFMKYLETEMEKVFLPKDQIKSLLQKFESIKPEPELLLSQYVASSSNQPPEQADKVIDKENTPTKRIGF